MAALRLVGLADRGGGPPETRDGAEEPPVLRLGPTHQTGPAPPVLAEAVEPAVVPDPVGRIRLDVVACVVPELRPRIEEAWPPCDDGTDRCAPVIDIKFSSSR